MIHRRVIRVGGSLALLIPRDVAEMIGVSEGSPVTLTLDGRRLIVDPTTGRVEEAHGVEQPNRETVAAMRELDRGGMPRVRSVRALLEELNADD